MRVRLDWEVVNEGETIAPEARRGRLSRLRRVPRWAWYTTSALLVTCLLAGGVSVHRRYREAQRRVSFQIVADTQRSGVRFSGC